MTHQRQRPPTPREPHTTEYEYTTADGHPMPSTVYVTPRGEEYEWYSAEAFEAMAGAANAGQVPPMPAPLPPYPEPLVSLMRQGVFDVAYDSGWGVRWIGVGSSVPTLVLVGLTAKTRYLLRQGKMARIAQDTGLDEDGCKAIFHADVPHKYLLLAVVGEVLRDPVLREAFLAHPKGGMGDPARERWALRYGAAVSRLGLSVPREVSVAVMVALVCPVTPAK